MYNEKYDYLLGIGPLVKDAKWGQRQVRRMKVALALLVRLMAIPYLLPLLYLLPNCTETGKENVQSAKTCKGVVY